jgi:hypothetical protein
MPGCIGEIMLGKELRHFHGIWSRSDLFISEQTFTLRISPQFRVAEDSERPVHVRGKLLPMGETLTYDKSERADLTRICATADGHPSQEIVTAFSVASQAMDEFSENNGNENVYINGGLALRKPGRKREGGQLSRAVLQAKL